MMTSCFFHNISQYYLPTNACSCMNTVVARPDVPSITQMSQFHPLHNLPCCPCKWCTLISFLVFQIAIFQTVFFSKFHMQSCHHDYMPRLIQPPRFEHPESTSNSSLHNFLNCPLTAFLGEQTTFKTMFLYMFIFLK